MGNERDEVSEEMEQLMAKYNGLKLDFERIQNEIEVNGHEMSKEKLETKRKDMLLVMGEIEEELKNSQNSYRNLEQLVQERREGQLRVIAEREATQSVFMKTVKKLKDAKINKETKLRDMTMQRIEIVEKKQLYNQLGEQLND